MTAPAIKTVPQSEVAEVAAYAKAARALAKWKENNPAAAAELAQLARVHNTLLKVADGAVRKLEVSCGAFELFEMRAAYDAEALYEGVGRQLFAQLGGVLATVETKTIEKDRFEALILQGRINAGLLAKVRSYGARYHAPKALVIEP
jgi:hypothetical protein